MDPKTLEGVGEQLVTLVRHLLGANAVIPVPFPVDQQLSDLGVKARLKMVNLMLAVEIEFDIAIPSIGPYITPENFHSVAAIEGLVVRTLSQRK